MKASPWMVQVWCIKLRKKGEKNIIEYDIYSPYRQRNLYNTTGAAMTI